MLNLWQLIVAALCAFVLYSIVSAATSPTRQIPGPFLARFTRLWYLHSVWKGNHRYDAHKLHRKYATDSYYAPMVRLAPNLFSIMDADKRVYGIGSKMQKSSWYKAWSPPAPDKYTLFSDQDIHRHNSSRRKFQSIYSLTSVLGYEKYVEDCTAMFVDRMSTLAKSDSAFDMARWFQFYAFDVITDITYGKRLGFLDKGDDVEGIIEADHASMLYSTLMGIYSELHQYLYATLQKLPGNGAAGRLKLVKFVITNKTSREAQRKTRGIGEGVEEKQGMPKDVLDRLLDLKEGNQKGLTDNDVVMMLMANIIAGADTTAFTLSGILYSLIRAPQAMRQLRTEIRDRIERGLCDQYNFPFKACQEMPYLQACIKEGLRIHAVIRLPLWRTVHEGGIEISGTYLPAGADVGVHVSLAHMNADIWGPDVEEFRPERWIEAEKEDREKLKTMEHNFMAVSTTHTLILSCCSC